MASNETILMAQALAVPRKFSAGDDEDVSPALTVQYIGSEASATVTVSSAGDITFKHGASAAEAVDATIDSGGDDDGVIDVSDANANTAIEVANLINASPNWRCFMGACCPDDNMDASTGSLLARAATAAKVDAGVPLFYDGSKILKIGYAITGHEFISTVNSPGQFNNGLKDDENCVNVLDYVAVNNDFSSAATFKVYEADQSSATATQLYSVALSDATLKELGGSTYISPASGWLESSMGKRIVARVETDAAVNTQLDVQGRVIDYTGDRVPANP